MYKKILEMIGKYDKIVIHRHLNPDLDALGAQLGLKGIIEENFDNKIVKVVGDENQFSFIGKMDDIEDSFYEGALAIIVDVAVSALVSDQRYTHAKEVLVIDHHQNPSDIATVFHSDPTHIATCQILTDLCMKESLIISESTATALFSGLVTDSGRFMYPATNETTFLSAWFLAKNGAKIQEIYDALYVEDLSFKKLKGHFINNFKTTKENIAYMKNTVDLKDEYNVSSFTISRGMVNQMSGIKGIPMWANFTEFEDGTIQCELRSKEIPIVDIAKKYGGGGHNLACGCTVHNWEDTDHILSDMDKLLKENQHAK
ncbi:MAG: DHH family phosphoesterase [Candidatus Izemoplasmataceae bacterium]